MLLDLRRRQKKLEKRAAKRKERLNSLARENPSDVRGRFRQAVNAPIAHSPASGSIFEQGIGHVLLSREIAPGQLAFSVFLLDLYCLGVKDAVWNIRSRDDIAAAACPESFPYGNDGKPFYIAGPYENATRRQQIIKQLEDRFGPEGFHFLYDVSQVDLIADEIDFGDE